MPSLRLRLISDIHGNLPALEKVLSHPEGLSCDHSVCLGDVTGYGPWPGECIELVRGICDIVVAGNHDLGSAGLLPLSMFNTWGGRALAWSAGRFSSDQLAWLSGLPLTAEKYGCGFCHAHPLIPGSWQYITDETRAGRVLDEIAGRPWFFGHTHVACAWGAGGARTVEHLIRLEQYPLVNCGSVGQPRDGDPRAALTVVDTEARTAETFRISYPVETTSREILRNGLPGFLAERLFTGS